MIKLITIWKMACVVALITIIYNLYFIDVCNMTYQIANFSCMLWNGYALLSFAIAFWFPNVLLLIKYKIKNIKAIK
jgi:hypothetical protein